MANTNSNMHKAKSAKNDEFYTLLTDIEKEMKYYRDQFKDKVIYCNCDDARESNFFKYFSLNFEFLGLKKLISTGYKEDGKGVVLIYDGGKNGNKIVEDSEIEVHELEGNGDFRSEECIEFLKEADIVVTNPPFSLFREYVAQLMEYEKKFCILGNMNAVTYKEIFPFVQNGKLWYGKSLHGIKCSFIVPNDYNGKSAWVENGIKYAPVNNAVWFTNLETNKVADAPTLVNTYNETDYFKYDNYDGIECSKIANIPYDYNGVIGVPITIIDKVCSDGFIHFETPMLEESDSRYHIVKFRKGDDDKDLAINGYTPYFRVLIQKVQ